MDGQLFYLNVDSYFSLDHFHIHIFSSQVACKHFKARDISFNCFVSSHHWALWKYMRTNQMRKAKSFYFELTVVRKSTTVTWVLTDWKESKGVGKFYSGKRGRLRYALFGGYWHGEAQGRRLDVEYTVWLCRGEYLSLYGWS